MDKYQDFRLNNLAFKEMIGKDFIKYRCDPFLFTNTVYQIIGIYIEDCIYKLFNEATAINYYGMYEDIAVWSITKSTDSEIHSSKLNQEQIDTPVNEKIKKITLVNENQKVSIEAIQYDVWITRAIIFHLETKDIYFMKDSSAFSEEIEIKRGSNLLNDFPKYNEFFMEGWTDSVNPQIHTEFITIE